MTDYSNLYFKAYDAYKHSSIEQLEQILKSLVKQDEKLRATQNAVQAIYNQRLKHIADARSDSSFLKEKVK